MPEHKIAESTVNIALTVGFYFVVFGLGSFVCGFIWSLLLFFSSLQSFQQEVYLLPTRTKRAGVKTPQTTLKIV